jgi:hypothetical protein
MGQKSEEFRVKARELEERAQTVIGRNARTVLLDAAERWHRLAREVERDEFDEPANKQPTKPGGA